jgi:hypothetical protein
MSIAHFIRGGIAVLFVCAITACGGSSGGGDGNTTTPDASGNIAVTFNLASLPGSITYNRTTTPDGGVEFEWSATFDVNGDGKIGQGDIILQVLQFKDTGSTERTGTVNDLPAWLWVYTTDTAMQGLVEIDKQISGNTITLTARKSLDPALAKIDGSVPVYFETFMRSDNADVRDYDYYPSQRSVTAIPSGGEFVDVQDDVDFPAIDMISMRISL